MCEQDWAGLLEDTRILLRDFEAGHAKLNPLEVKKLNVMAEVARNKVPAGFERADSTADDEENSETNPPPECPLPNVHKLSFSPPIGSESTSVPSSHPALSGSVGSVSRSVSSPRVKGPCAACCRDATSTCKRCNLTVYCSRTCQVRIFNMPVSSNIKGENLTVNQVRKQFYLRNYKNKAQ
jgi:hypothetical protein